MEDHDPQTGEIVEEQPKDHHGPLRNWVELCRTDPRHTKAFRRAGGFAGTSTRPIWNYMLLTEHFGPHGIGWGTREPKYQIVPADDEILVYCTLECWYIDPHTQERATIYGVGGDKARVREYRDNRQVVRADDEAFKKAFTDALGNAFTRVGLNADVHMGLFEDSKYVESSRRYFASGQQEVAQVEAAPPSTEIGDPLIKAAWIAADTGDLEKLEGFWTGLTPAQRKMLGPDRLALMKEHAMKKGEP